MKPAHVINCGTYCVLFVSAILCNKYVLSVFGFQYPTIFQAWQNLVACILTYILQGNTLSKVSIKDFKSWSPGMLFYIGTIYSGSIALAKNPIPVYLIGNSGSDIILHLTDNEFISSAVHWTISMKAISIMLIFWNTSLDDFGLRWLVVNMLFSGIYKSLTYWYDKPGLRSTYLLVKRRQCLHLNNISSVFILFPLGIYMGHHQKIAYEFSYLKSPLFYALCFISGILCFTVSNVFYSINETLPSHVTDLLHIVSRYLALFVAMQTFTLNHSFFLWISIIFGLSSDLIYVFSIVYYV